MRLTKAFITCFRAVFPFASTDVSRPRLNAVLVEIDEKGGVRVVATDDHTLACAHLQPDLARPIDETDPLPQGKWTLPRENVEWFANLSRKDEKAATAVRFEPGTALAVEPHIVRPCPLSDKVFPPWRNAIPDADQSPAPAVIKGVNADYLARVVKAVREIRRGCLNNRCTLRPNSDLAPIEFSAENPDAGIVFRCIVMPMRL